MLIFESERIDNGRAKSQFARVAEITRFGDKLLIFFHRLAAKPLRRFPSYFTSETAKNIASHAPSTVSCSEPKQKEDNKSTHQHCCERLRNPIPQTQGICTLRNFIGYNFQAMKVPSSGWSRLMTVEDNSLIHDFKLFVCCKATTCRDDISSRYCD